MRTRALVAGITMAGCVGLSTVSPALLPTAPAVAATPWPGHPDREIVDYTVRSGDTLYGLAVRFHAWTRELAAINHLSTSSTLWIGEHLRIPVVTSGRGASSSADTQAARIARAVAAVRARFTYPGAKPWRGHPNRILVPYTVNRYDTVYGIAVRYRAWTRELVSLNHITRLHSGQHIRIPIVVTVMRLAEKEQIDAAVRAASTRQPAHRSSAHRVRRISLAQRMAAEGWVDWGWSRHAIRSLIAHTAERNHVSPTLALAIAWQESGWHEPLISGAGAIGVMQLLPGTADWMSLYAGRQLNPRSTRDNVLAGVLFLRYLQALAGRGHTDQIIAAYYQGMSAIGKKPRWFNDTKQYVRSVTAIYEQIAHGGGPSV